MASKNKAMRAKPPSAQSSSLVAAGHMAKKRHICLCGAHIASMAFYVNFRNIISIFSQYLLILL